MKAVSLWQPWASAIPLRLKKFETRGWKTSHRRLIAIHAAKRWTREQREFANRMGIDITLFGMVIAIAFLYDIYDLNLLGLFVSDLERSWGDYSPNRYGWGLTNVVALSKPFPYRGGQGIFNVPDSLIESGR